jgi:hypothetical protein
VNQEAQLTVLLTLKDQLSSGVSAATSKLSGLGSMGSVASKALSGVENAAGHAVGQLSKLAGSLGMMGLAGGLFAVVGFAKSAVSSTEQFGEAVLQLHKFTGESTESLSSLASAMVASGTATETAQKSIGMMNKLIGGMSTKQEIDYETKYGFALRDTAITATQLAAAEATLTNKKASAAQQTAASTLLNTYFSASYKSTNDLILQAADLYNNALTPSEDKAAAMAKVFGRSWQTLIPLFEQGSDGIRAVEAQAASMGMVITTENLPAIEKMHDASIRWNQAMGGLQLQIGLALLPAISDLADSASSFVTGHGADIVKFFKDAEKFGQELGSVIQHDVIPVFGMIAGAWNAIPGELKTLLITGFAVQKASSWLFGGGGIIGGLTGLAKTAASATGSSIGGLGVQQVFVTNWAMMGGGGLGGGAALGGEAAAGGATAAGGIGLGTVALGAAAIASTALAAYMAKQFADQTGQQQADTNKQISDWGMKSTTPAENAAALSGEVSAYRSNTSNPLGSALTNTFAGSQTATALTTAADKIAQGATIAPESIQALKDAIGVAQNMGNQTLVNRLSDDLATAQRKQTQTLASAPPKPTVLSAADKAAINSAANVAHGDVMAQLRGQLSGTKAVADGAAIAKVYGTGTVTNLQWTQKNINELTAVQKAFAARGDTATAAALGADIAVLRDALAGKLDQVVVAIGAMPTGGGPGGGVAGRVGTTPYAGENYNTGGTNTGGTPVLPLKVVIANNISAKDVTSQQTVRTSYRSGVPT